MTQLRGREEPEITIAISEEDYDAFSREDLQEIARGLWKYERNKIFMKAHLEEYRERYPNQYVVVQDGKFIGAGDTLLYRVLEEQGFDLKHSYTMHMKPGD